MLASNLNRLFLHTKQYHFSFPIRGFLSYLANIRSNYCNQRWYFWQFLFFFSVASPPCVFHVTESRWFLHMSCKFPLSLLFSPVLVMLFFTRICEFKSFYINHFLKYCPILFTLTTNSNHVFISDLYQFKKHSFKMYTFVYITGHLLDDPSMKYRIYLRSSCLISSETYILTWINDSLSGPTCMIWYW